MFTARTNAPEGELYLLDKEGVVSQLTVNNRHETNPALSPDGKKVVFTAGDENVMSGWEIYVLDIASGVETRLTTNDVIDAHPDWSPSGLRLCFSSWRDAGGNPTAAADIYVMNADGSEQTALSPTPWEDNDPEWSPDGARIAFKSTRNSGQPAREEIFVMDTLGNGIVRLTTTSGWESDHDPSWSPDSKSIVCNRYQGSRPWTDGANLDTMRVCWQELTPWNVCLVDAASGATEQLTAAVYSMGLPTWVADGSGVLYLGLDFIILGDSLIGADHRLVLIAPDGSNPQQLIPDDTHTPTLEFYDW